MARTPLIALTALSILLSVTVCNASQETDAQHLIVQNEDTLNIVATAAEAKPEFGSIISAENEPKLSDITSTEDEPQLKDITYAATIWGEASGSTVCIDYSTRHGDRPYSYKLSSPEKNDIRYALTYDLKPHTWYYAESYIRTEDVEVDEEGFIGANIRVNTGDWNYSASIEGTTDWTKASLLFMTGDDGHVEISMDLGYWYSIASGTAWFDGISVQEVDDTSITTPATWKYLFVILRNIDVNYHDPVLDYDIVRKDSYTDQEIAELYQCMDVMREQIPIYSEQKLNLDIDVVVIDPPYTGEFAVAGEGTNMYWISPESAYEFLSAQQIDPTAYDHICMTTIMGDYGSGYLGLGGTFIHDNAGYSFITGGSHENLETCWKNDTPAAAFIHEFLHAAESYAGRMGYNVPDLHDAEEYGYTNEREWEAWYIDYMTNNIENAQTEEHGIPERVWAIPPTLLRNTAIYPAPQE